MKYAIVHIADIHYKQDKPESSSSVIKACFEDIKKQQALLPEHEFYIAITGDIVYSGGDDESYLKFKEEFDSQLNSIGLSKDFRIIVPGNHDIDRGIVETRLPEYVKIKESNLIEESFNDHIHENELYIQKFENYELFESDFAKYGIDYSTHGKGWMIDDKLGVYCLNTALCSFGGVNKINDEQHLSVGTRDLVNWCNTSKKDINILLMHHPIDHLTEWSKQEIIDIVEDNFFLCLCGHRHSQSVYYNMISQNSLICSGPQLFSKKDDPLGYGIVLIEDNSVDKIIYRGYAKGKFLTGAGFAGNDEGVVDIQNTYSKNKKLLELKLKQALEFFKDQKVTFVEPKISETREFSDEENLLPQMIKMPESVIINAPPQFGKTCISHYLRLEAYKERNFWIYIDAEHIKKRKIEHEIEEQLHTFCENKDRIKCIIIDSWDSSVLDHINILKFIDEQYSHVPIIVMSRDSGLNLSSNFSFSTLKTKFKSLHLQALTQAKIRDVVVGCYGSDIVKEDDMVTQIARHFKTVNIHRTPLNCLTLLKVFERHLSENLVNRTSMINAVLFTLFTDLSSFSYATNKPAQAEVELILGRFCKTLIKEKRNHFKYSELIDKLKKYSKEGLVNVKVEEVVNILEENHILLRYNDNLEFKHNYWIFYFGAIHMLTDKDFKEYILADKLYVNFPEIIDFYTGIDGRREDTVKFLMNDIESLVKEVEEKMGISDGELNPFNGFHWNPSKEAILALDKDIKEKVQHSKLPKKIKDQQADKHYNPLTPYNKEINTLLHKYSVTSLMQSVKAASRALRNSPLVSSKLKLEMFQSIMNGWSQISKVIFLLSPTLAHLGRAQFHGFSLILGKEFKGDFNEKMKNIFMSNPYNVAKFLKDDLSSKKLGLVVSTNLEDNKSELQRHFIALFSIMEKPEGWYEYLFKHMNLLHRNSFYLANILDILRIKMEHGFNTQDELTKLNNLVEIVLAKHKNAPKLSKAEDKLVPPSKISHPDNKLPIDKILIPKKPLNDKFRKIQK